MQAAIASIYMNKHRIHTIMNHVILYAYNTPTLKDYSLERTEWNEHIFQSIDQNLTEKYMDFLEDSHCANVVKIIHYWQDTG